MESQQLAENLYCTTRLSQEEISSLVGINRKTLYTWIKDKNWVRQPHAEEVVPLRLLSKCYSQIEYLLNESEYIDPEYCQHHFKGISVMIRAINSLKPKKKENQYVTVMTEFMNLIRVSAPGMADELLPFICQFIETHNLEMPGTPPPSNQPAQENLPKNDLAGFMAPLNQPNQTMTSRTMKCAAPRKRLIKPKKKNNTKIPPLSTTTKNADTKISKNKNADKTNLINKNNKNSRQTTHTPDAHSAPKNGVHGVQTAQLNSAQIYNYQSTMKTIYTNVTPHFLNFKTPVDAPKTPITTSARV